MAEILLDNITTPGTPPNGQSFIWVDSTTKKLITTDDSGIHRGILSHNQMIAASGSSAAADTYLTNSGILIPSFGLQVGMMFQWIVHVSKTNVGTTAAVVTFRIGSAQAVGDTSILALTQTTAQAAVADSGQMIATAYVAVSGASGIMACAFGFSSGAVGFKSGKDGQSSTIDLTARQGQYIGISINSQTGATWTWTGVWARLLQ